MERFVTFVSLLCPQDALIMTMAEAASLSKSETVKLAAALAAASVPESRRIMVRILVDAARTLKTFGKAMEAFTLSQIQPFLVKEGVAKSGNKEQVTERLFGFFHECTFNTRAQRIITEAMPTMDELKVGIKSAGGDTALAGYAGESKAVLVSLAMALMRDDPALFLFTINEAVLGRIAAGLGVNVDYDVHGNLMAWMQQQPPARAPRGAAMFLSSAATGVAAGVAKAGTKRRAKDMTSDKPAHVKAATDDRKKPRAVLAPPPSMPSATPSWMPSPTVTPWTAPGFPTYRGIDPRYRSREWFPKYQ